MDRRVRVLEEHAIPFVPEFGEEPRSGQAAGSETEAGLATSSSTASRSVGELAQERSEIVWRHGVAEAPRHWCRRSSPSHIEIDLRRNRDIIGEEEGIRDREIVHPQPGPASITIDGERIIGDFHRPEESALQNAGVEIVDLTCCSRTGNKEIESEEAEGPVMGPAIFSDVFALHHPEIELGVVHRSGGVTC